jgi:predicted dehydrogenase
MAHRDSRRGFLKKAGVAAAALGWSGAINAAGANEKVVIGVIGCGGRGGNLAKEFGQIQYACDPDEKRLGKLANANKIPSSNTTSDMRRLLDNKAIDAVVIATPDHWHAPAALLALEAGKHVYLEKPCSHNFREGRLLVDAARRHKRVVQHGTQSRSNGFIAGAIQMLREGVIGDVLAAKAWNVQRRESIGHMQPSAPPAGVDYDLWVGPAEFLPYQENRFHYSWHWWYNFGTGDVGNDGTHEIDYARWGLGVDTLPSRIAGLGGKYAYDDDQQFPDTATIVYEYPGDGKVGSRRQLIFEMRLWSTNYPFNCDNGAEFYGTKGKMSLSKRGKIEILGPRNAKIEKLPELPPNRPKHAENFLDAIKTGRQPNAGIEEAHRSVALVHLGNLAVRLGRALNFDPPTEQITGDEEANGLLSRHYRKEGHWAIPQLT